MVASNPAVSEQTGWPIGFWWGELTHPYWEFTQQGYVVDLASPSAPTPPGWTPP
jgi:putative intracellular protease/amidase